MRVLIGCEESQVVCKAFRAKGHEAFSCDVIDCSGGHPERHIKGDVLDMLDMGWDLGIFHPPCTFLSNAGIRYFNLEKYGERAEERMRLRLLAADFFLKLYNAPIDKVCVENPVGWMNSTFRKPDQTVHPYFFGDNDMKRTCFWLRNLKPLMHIKHGDMFYQQTHSAKPEPVYIDKRRPGKYYKGGEPKKRYFTEALGGNRAEDKKRRSKTFPGIANAMAEQWGME